MLFGGVDPEEALSPAPFAQAVIRHGPAYGVLHDMEEAAQGDEAQEDDDVQEDRQFIRVMEENPEEMPRVPGDDPPVEDGPAKEQDHQPGDEPMADLAMGSFLCFFLLPFLLMPAAVDPVRQVGRRGGYEAIAQGPREGPDGQAG